MLSDFNKQHYTYFHLFSPHLGQVFSQKLLSLRDQHKTAEGSPSDDDSYLGYSVATGEFNGDGDNADVVVGMPRGANLTGKVQFFKKKSIDKKSLIHFGFRPIWGKLRIKKG